MGLLQASSVVYGGRTFGPGHHTDLRKVFGNSTYPDYAYFILPLGKHDFTKLNRMKYDFPRQVKFLRDVIVGLATLHGAGILHRDVTVANMLVMSDDPPVGVLCDFGKAVQEEWETYNGVAPAYARAPEIDGTERYNEKADVWSCGLAFASVLLPDMSKWPSFNPDHAQSRKWVREVCERLEKFGSQSMFHGMIAIIVAKMLDYDPGTRPPMCVVLDKWPLDVSAKAEENRLGIGGPRAKVPKASAVSKGYRNGSYGLDWFGIQPVAPEPIILGPITRARRAAGYNGSAKSGAAILPSKRVVDANLCAAEVMRQGQGFTPERPSQKRFEYTVGKLAAMAEKQQADEEASTEILADNELSASTGGPSWDKVADWKAPAEGGDGDPARHTPAGPWENGASW